MSFNVSKWHALMGVCPLLSRVHQMHIEKIHNNLHSFDQSFQSAHNNERLILKEDRIAFDHSSSFASSGLKNAPSTIQPSLFVQEHALQKNNYTNAPNIALNKISTLQELYTAIDALECSVKQFAKNTVIYDGNPNAKLMLIGEAPGEKEDEKGIPFCGQSGILLDLMLASIGFNRKDSTYITNSFFWRPPANRTPTYEEITQCKPFVQKHIALIKPQLLVLVGATAVKSVLGNQYTSITAMRGKYIKYINPYLQDDIDLTCIFHPAYLLRQSTKKKIAWCDLINIKKFFIQRSKKI